MLADLAPSLRRLRAAGRAEVFRFMDAPRLVVRATSLGDVHSMMLNPVMRSHREISAQAPAAHGHP
jgi:cystathionine gamma-synthase/methionine-gamma-lyase